MGFRRLEGGWDKQMDGLRGWGLGPTPIGVRQRSVQCNGCGVQSGLVGWGER